MTRRLSILICSLDEREESKDRLLSCLQRQLTDEVEILIETDNRQSPTGTKRNRLLDRAAGDYIVFIDDDDLVSDDYISKILEATKTNPDCCKIEGLICRKGKEPQKFISSMKINIWNNLGSTLLMATNHLCPVKRKLAVQARFPDIYREEDILYADNLRPLLKTEVDMEGSLYYWQAQESES